MQLHAAKHSLIGTCSLRSVSVCKKHAQENNGREGDV
jgi:hypothetical protein